MSESREQVAKEIVAWMGGSPKANSVEKLADLLDRWGAVCANEARLDEARQSPHEGMCTTLKRSGKPCNCARGKRIEELERLKAEG